MTGRGAAAAAGRLARVEVELSSVNRKQLDVDVGLPRFLAAYESRVLELVQNRLSRATPRLPSAVTQQGVRVDKSRSNFLLFAILTSDDPAWYGQYVRQR